MASEEKRGTCPKCKSTEVDYDSMQYEGDFVYYPVECTDCGHEFNEYYDLVFSGQEDRNS